MALAAAGCASPAGWTVPLREGPEGAFSFELWIGDDPVPRRFLLDTGANALVLDPALADAADPVSGLGPVAVAGVAASIVRDGLRGTVAISLAPRGVAAPALPPAEYRGLPVPDGFDGVAGLGVFGERAVVLDLGAGRLEIRDGPPPAEDGTALPVRFEAGLPVLEVEVAGRRVEAVLDTGFPGGLYLPPRIADSLPWQGPGRRRVRLQDVHGSRDALERRLAGPVRLGPLEIPDPWVLVGDGTPLVGNALLRRMRLTLEPAGGSPVAKSMGNQDRP
jgi:predicted aspartyl protease